MFGHNYPFNMVFLKKYFNNKKSNSYPTLESEIVIHSSEATLILLTLNDISY